MYLSFGKGDISHKVVKLFEYSRSAYLMFFGFQGFFFLFQAYS